MCEQPLIQPAQSGDTDNDGLKIWSRPVGGVAAPMTAEKGPDHKEGEGDDAHREDEIARHPHPDQRLHEWAVDNLSAARIGIVAGEALIGLD